MDLFEASQYHLREVQRVRGHEDANHPTLKLYGLYERRHLDYLEANHLEPRLDMLNPHTVSSCQLWIRAQHGYGIRNGRTAEAAYVQIVKIWSSFLRKKRVIPEDLLLGFEKPHVPKIMRRCFTRAEAERLFAVAGDSYNPERDRAIMLLLADTGCRVGELCGLELEDVLSPDGELRASIRIRKTKGGIPRDVKIGADGFVGGGPSIEALRRWLRVRPAQPDVRALFVTTTAYQPSRRHDGGGEPLSPARVRDLHRRWGLKAHVSPCFPHMWRHTAATEAMTAGVGENSIRDRLGHISKPVLDAYLHQSDRTRDRAAELSSLSSKWSLGQAPGDGDLASTKLKHDMEELLRGDPAIVRQILTLAAALKPNGSLSA